MIEKFISRTILFISAFGTLLSLLLLSGTDSLEVSYSTMGKLTLITIGFITVGAAVAKWGKID